MSIKILLPKSSSAIAIPFSEFKEVMGVQYLERMHFASDTVRAKIEQRCAQAHQKKQMGQRQLWLGQYYARELEKSFVPDVTIAWIDDRMGYGVFANRDIPAFTYIGEYLGVLRRPYFFKDRSNYYCFNYYITMNYWAQNLWAPYLIDAREEGNFTRYINHSDTPNLDMGSAYYQGWLHIIFYTKAAITKGTQLGYDYGPIYWEKRSKPLLLHRFVNAEELDFKNERGVGANL
jgi:hypothetical protein